MEFALSDEQRELKEATAAFAKAKLNQDLAKRDALDQVNKIRHVDELDRHSGPRRPTER